MTKDRGMAEAGAYEVYGCVVSKWDLARSRAVNTTPVQTTMISGHGEVRKVAIATTKSGKRGQNRLLESEPELMEEY